MTRIARKRRARAAALAALALLAPGAAPAANAATEAAAWSCRFTLASEGSADLNGWVLATRGIDHPHRIEMDPDDPDRARIVAALDAIEARVDRREAMLRFHEEAGEGVAAVTTIFLVDPVEGAHPAVHTSQQVAEPAFASITLLGACTPEE